MQISFSWFSLFIMASVFSNVHAKSNTTTYVLKDPVTDAPLPNTPYFMGVVHEKTQGKPLLTDAQGKTRPSSEKPLILVQAEGVGGKELFISNLSEPDPDTDTRQAVKGAPYLIFNIANNQALCGHINAEGFTHAYYMDNAKLWYNNGYTFQRQNDKTCSESRTVARQLFDKDSTEFTQGYDQISQTFVIDDQQQKYFLYSHIDDIIQDKSIDLSKRATKAIINRGVQIAIDNQDGKSLNSIGYSLGFNRKEYKQGLKLLDESLNISPQDCYASNSKGYLLMRTGKVKDAQRYFYEADQACQAARLEATSEYNLEPTDYSYPIAVNYAHLAESYALLNDPFLANDFFVRALEIASIPAKDEIVEVAESLTKQKILSNKSASFLSYYLQAIEKYNQEQSARASYDLIEESSIKIPKE